MKATIKVIEGKHVVFTPGGFSGFKTRAEAENYIAQQEANDARIKARARMTTEEYENSTYCGH